jgi:hypothetical protein
MLIKASSQPTIEAAAGDRLIPWIEQDNFELAHLTFEKTGSLIKIEKHCAKRYSIGWIIQALKELKTKVPKLK